MIVDFYYKKILNKLDKKMIRNNIFHKSMESLNLSDKVLEGQSSEGKGFLGF